ncbi:MAG: cytochrome c-type biogenesis protein CcmH [Betaproteobacteria bacterium]|nr:cytochrome c-type biogenesis protein CcmH [Betaproteobacteria bacterium]
MIDLHSITKSNPSIGEGFRARVAGEARQCLSFVFVCVALACSSAFAQTATPELPPASPELELRLKKLETELRCLVCQNQTLAESPAGLAGDLRREVRLLADAGKNDEEIKAHLKARYGDFVLYKPPVESKTWLLWFGPFVLLLGGAVIVVAITRRTRAVSAEAPKLNETDRDRASKLLGDN